MRTLMFTAAVVTSLSAISFSFAAEPPAVGEAAPDVELRTIDGTEVKLSSAAGKGPVVLVVLRGYPGYQCPICTRQVGSLIQSADKLAAAGASVLMIYPGPGPAEKLSARAREFLKDVSLPPNFTFTIDPEYGFTNAWGLRWNTERETAYPSTFVIGRDMKVAWSKISKTHGGRASAQEVLTAVQKLNKK